jgi:hypothetical protein
VQIGQNTDAAVCHAEAEFHANVNSFCPEQKTVLFALLFAAAYAGERLPDDWIQKLWPWCTKYMHELELVFFVRVLAQNVDGSPIMGTDCHHFGDGMYLAISDAGSPSAVGALSDLVDLFGDGPCKLGRHQLGRCHLAQHGNIRVFGIIPPKLDSEVMNTYTLCTWTTDVSTASD